MKQPVDHIIRPQLPWRDGGGVTECGLDASNVPALTRDEFLGRLKDMGQQRTAMVTCMTCFHTARRWGTWADDPRKALEREISWECLGTLKGRGQRLRHELLAIERLIAAHPTEFADYVEEAGRRQEWLELKARRSP